LRTNGSQLLYIIRDIQTYDFIKFNIHNRLQGRLPTPKSKKAASSSASFSGEHNVDPLRTTRSQLQFIIRDILYNNFIKFNLHCKLQGQIG
jgi:hypothetical protein